MLTNRLTFLHLLPMTRRYVALSPLLVLLLANCTRNSVASIQTLAEGRKYNVRSIPVLTSRSVPNQQRAIASQTKNLNEVLPLAPSHAPNKL